MPHAPVVGVAEPRTMAELLEEMEGADRRLRPLRLGEAVEGTVVDLSNAEALVDLGGRPAGVLPLRDAPRDLTIGDSVVVTVVLAEGPQGHAVLSLRRARDDVRWQPFLDHMANGDILDATVVEANRGGVVVDIGARGFVPLSQLSRIGALQRSAEDEQPPEQLRALVGTRLSVKVIEVDPQRGRLVLSEKAAARDVRRSRKAEAAGRLAVSQVLEGVVTQVAGFGLFVDIGAADGLVHRSEITWDKTGNPLARYAVGERVRVVVIEADSERNRVSLSIKRLSPDPWARVGTEFVLGQDLEVTVTRLMPFGAFVRLAEGLEGLIHISELADHRIADPSEEVRMGDMVRARIVGIDVERRRLSLSLRGIDANV